MKLTKIAGALLVASLPAIAAAGVTFTPMVGYSEYGSAAHNQYVNALKTYNLDNAQTNALALGLELTPSITTELEYNVTDTNTRAFNLDAREKQYNANVLVTSDIITKNYTSNFKPYALVGVGQSDIKVNGNSTHASAGSKDTLGNVGLGAFYRLNDAVALRGEVRGAHNFDNDYWEGIALAGLQLTLGGHLGKAAPIIKPVAPVVPVIPDVDTDGDGVVDRLDKCPGTPHNVVVDADGCPVQDVENMKLELRVYFDNAKSAIKPQYDAEISKVAGKLKDFPSVTSVIEGHTSKTGSRAFNERLSVARANAVKDSLVTKYGIDGSRLTTAGYAWDRPVATNATAEGQAMNRRVYAVFNGTKTVVKTK